jgi:hypothetical protein
MRQAAGIAVLMVLVAGCAAESATLVNDKGERWYCTKSMGGGLTSSNRTRDFESCLNAADLQGFRRIDK